jgi:hypothetical protein
MQQGLDESSPYIASPAAPIGACRGLKTRLQKRRLSALSPGGEGIKIVIGVRLVFI